MSKRLDQPDQSLGVVDAAELTKRGMIRAGDRLLDGAKIVHSPQAIDEFVEQSLGANRIGALQAIGDVVQELLGLLQVQARLCRGQVAPAE